MRENLISAIVFLVAALALACALLFWGKADAGNPTIAGNPSTTAQATATPNATQTQPQTPTQTATMTPTPTSHHHKHHKKTRIQTPVNAPD